MEARYSLMNTKKALEKELKDLLTRVNELTMDTEDAVDLYIALTDAIEDIENDLDAVNYELGEYL